MIHGFIDGYSRLITGLRASNNNRAETVLNVFLHAAQQYGVPLRLRGDHGIENVQVAAWMEEHVGQFRGSYIWGRLAATGHSNTTFTDLTVISYRSVHNVRIERLWVDIGVQVTSTWSDHFTRLEFRHGLDINNRTHIWLLHYLFLPSINAQLDFFAAAWNQHRIQIRHGPNRSPADMFGFDMLALGVRGYRLPQNTNNIAPAFPHHNLPNLPGQLSEEVYHEEVLDDVLPDDDIETFGVDWEAYQDNHVRQSLIANDTDTGETSWVRQRGPPNGLSGVELDGPRCPLSETEIGELENEVEEL